MMMHFGVAPKNRLFTKIISIKYPTLCLILTVLGIFLSLSPLFQVSNGNTSGMTMESQLDVAFFDPEYQNSLLLSAVITIPMITDLLLDMMYVFKGNSGEILHWSIRLLLLATLTVPNIALYSSAFDQYSASFLYLCVSTLRVVTAAGCISIFISVGDATAGAGWKSVTILSFFTLGQLFLLYGHLNPGNETMFAFAFIFLSTAGLVLAQYASLTLYTFWVTEARLSSDDVCFIFYFTAIVLFSVSGLVLSSICGSFNPLNYSAGCLVSFEYLQMVFLVFVMVLPGRIVRFKLDGTLRQMKERQAFMRYISHEIRTPLNTVFLGMTFVRYTLSRRSVVNGVVALDNAVLMETVDEISNSCQIALSILNDLLTFDKIDSGQMKMELEETHPWQYLHSAVKSFSLQARQNNIRFTISCDEIETGWTQQYSLQIDQHKMSQVLRNLVSNAMKFTDEGGSVAIVVSHFTVQMEPSEPSRWRHSSSIGPDTNPSNFPTTQILRIEVRDSGAGISKENQSKLFGQYVQFNASKLQKGAGSGLGLWITKGIVELHGGTIGVISEGEGLGSTFYIELPMYLKNHSDTSADTQVALRKRGGLPSNSEREIRSNHSNSTHSIPSGPGTGATSIRPPEGTRFYPTIGGRGSSTRLGSNRTGVSMSMGMGGRRHWDSEGFAETTGHLITGGIQGLSSSPHSAVRAALSPNNPNGIGTVRFPSLRETIMGVLTNVEGHSRRLKSDDSSLSATQRFHSDSPATPVSVDRFAAQALPFGGRVYASSEKRYSFEITHKLNTPSTRGQFDRKGEGKDGAEQTNLNPDLTFLPENNGTRYVSVPPSPSSASSAVRHGYVPVAASTGALCALSFPFRRVSSTALDTLAPHVASPPPARSFFSNPTSDKGGGSGRTSRSGSIVGIGMLGRAGRSAPSAIMEASCEVSDSVAPSEHQGGGSQVPSPSESLSMSSQRLKTNIEAGVSYGDHESERDMKWWVAGGGRSGVSGVDSIPSPISGSGVLSNIGTGAGTGTGTGSHSYDSSVKRSQEDVTDKKIGKLGKIKMTDRDKENFNVKTGAHETKEIEETKGRKSDQLPMSDTSFLDRKVEDGGQERGEGEEQEGGGQVLFLIVDDSTSTRKIVRRLLQSQGHDVLEAADGAACLCVVEQARRKGTPVDIILMDDNMPNMSGPDAAVILRKSGFPGIICGVTGNTFEGDVQHFLVCGATFVLPKPLDLEALRGLIPMMQ